MFYIIHRHKVLCIYFAINLNVFFSKLLNHAEKLLKKFHLNFLNFLRSGADILMTKHLIEHRICSKFDINTRANLGIRFLKFGTRFHFLLGAIFVARNASILMIAIRPLASTALHISVSRPSRLLLLLNLEG